MDTPKRTADTEIETDTASYEPKKPEAMETLRTTIALAAAAGGVLFFLWLLDMAVQI